MPVTPTESNVGLLAQGKQTALGTPLAYNAAAVKRMRLRESSLSPIKEIGYEPYVDGSVFPDPTPYVTRIGGEVGDVTVQAQIETGGFLFAQLIGSDVVTGTNPDYTHTISSGNFQGGYQTIFQKLGSSQNMNLRFADALISKGTWRVGQDQMVAHFTESIRALSAAWFSTDPTATDSETDPFLWSEVTGAATIDGTPYAEISGETLEIDRQLDDYMGDSVAPCAFVPTAGQVTRSVDTIVSNNTLPILKDALWSTTTPSDGLAVTSGIKHVNLGTKYTRTAARSLEIQTSKVAVDLGDLDLSPNPEGGAKQLTIGGRCRPNGATPTVRVIAKTGDAAAYV